MKLNLDKFTIKQMFEMYDVIKTEFMKKNYIQPIVDYAISALLQELNFIQVCNTDIYFFVPEGKRLYTKEKTDLTLWYSDDKILLIEHHWDANLLCFDNNIHKRIDPLHTDKLHQLMKLPNLLLDTMGDEDVLTEKEKTIEFRTSLNELFKACLGHVYEELSGLDNMYLQLKQFNDTETILKTLKGQHNERIP